MDDEQTNHPHHFLHRHVRVIEERAVLPEREFVDELAARRNRILGNARHAIHFDRDLEAVPVHGGDLGQAVFDDEARPFPLADLDRRPRHAAVESPGVDGAPG